MYTTVIKSLLFVGPRGITDCANAEGGRGSSNSKVAANMVGEPKSI
jgi:hypothetical protein